MQPFKNANIDAIIQGIMGDEPKLADMADAIGTSLRQIQQGEFTVAYQADDKIKPADDWNHSS